MSKSQRRQLAEFQTQLAGFSGSRQFCNILKQYERGGKQRTRALIPIPVCPEELAQDLWQDDALQLFCLPFWDSACFFEKCLFRNIEWIMRAFLLFWSATGYIIISERGESCCAFEGCSENIIQYLDNAVRSHPVRPPTWRAWTIASDNQVCGSKWGSFVLGGQES